MQSLIEMEASLDSKKIGELYYYDSGHYSLMVPSAKAGNYRISVKYTWGDAPMEVRDYTIRTYFKKRLNIVDKFGKKNEIEMTLENFGK